MRADLRSQTTGSGLSNKMRKLSLLFLAAGLACAQSTLLDLTTGSGGASWVGSGSPVPTFRVEFRMPMPVAGVTIIANSGVLGVLDCLTNTDSIESLTCNLGDGTGSGNAETPVTSGADLRVRFQRDFVGLTYTLETWAGNCTNHTYTQKPIVSQSSGLAQASTFTLAGSQVFSFLRGYPALDTGGDCPTDNPAIAATLFDFPFEILTGGSPADTSPNGYTPTIASGSSYTSSAPYTPSAAVTGTGISTVTGTLLDVGSQNQAFTLSAANSVCFTYPGTGLCASYAWSQTSGTGCSFGASTSVSSPVTCTAAGQSVLGLSISDGTNTATASQTIGVVAVTASGGTTLTGDFAVTSGNVLRYGLSPWPWYDATLAADLNMMSPAVQATPTGVAGAGTVGIPSTGINTLGYCAAGPLNLCITENTYPGVAIQGVGTNFTSADIGTYIEITWDPDGNGSNLGHYVTYISQVPSSLIAVTGSYGILEPVAPLASGLTWHRLAVGTGTQGTCTATVAGGQLTGITCPSSANYRWWAPGPPSVTLSGGGGSGCPAISAVVSPYPSTTGAIVGFINANSGATVLPCGSGYTSAPSVALVAYSDWMGLYDAANQSAYTLDYYEAGLAMGRFAASTGLTAYQTQFHSFCTNWWRWALDSGYAPPIPRYSGLNFMLACATDPSWSSGSTPAQPPNMVSGVGRLITAMAPNLYTSTTTNESGSVPTADAAPALNDPREASYVLRPSSLLCAIGNDYLGGLGTTWCGNVQAQLTHLWEATAQPPAGYSSSTYNFYAENTFFQNPTLPLAASPALTGPFGTAPWRSDSLPSIALTYAYDALVSQGYSTAAAPLLNLTTGAGLIPSLASYIRDFGRSADGGIFANTQYASWSNAEPGWDASYGGNFFVYNSLYVNGYVSVSGTAVTATSASFSRQFYPGAVGNFCQPGGTGCANATIATVPTQNSMTLTGAFSGSAISGSNSFSNTAVATFTNGSSAVVGSTLVGSVGPTGFTTMFAPCNGTTFISIDNTAVSPNDRYIGQVMSCADDQHLTMNAAYPGTTGTFGSFAVSGAGQTNCAPMSITTLCQADDYGGRNLSADIGAVPAWLYAKTGAAPWKALLDYYYNKMFGGAAGGSGSLGTPAGTLTYLPGTVTVVAGSPTVAGIGTSFLSQFACNGTDSITVADGLSGGTWATYGAGAFNTPVFYTTRVASCASNGTLTLASPWPSAASGSTATNMFYNSIDPAWQGADGGTGNLGEILPGCGTGLLPCSGAVPFNQHYGKPVGMAAGAGNVPLAMADRAANPAAPSTGSVNPGGFFRGIIHLFF
jgi:hypothetical protein